MKRCNHCRKDTTDDRFGDCSDCGFSRPNLVVFNYGEMEAKAIADLMEVRCCCVPKKLLGWLPSPHSGAKRGHVENFDWSECGYDPAYASDKVPMVSHHSKVVSLPIELINHGTGTKPYLAYKSEETPIEILRKIPQFIENI